MGNSQVKSQVNSESRFEKYYNEMTDEIHANIQQGKKASPQLIIKVLQVHQLAQQQFAKIMQDQSLDKLDESHESAKSTSKTYNKKIFLVLSAFAAASLCTSGTLGIAGTTGFINVNKAIPVGLDSVGRGSQIASSIPEGMNQRDRTLHQHLQQLYTEVMREFRRLVQDSVGQCSRTGGVITTISTNEFSQKQALFGK